MGSPAVREASAGTLPARRTLHSQLRTLRPFEAAGLAGSEFTDNLRLLLEIQEGLLDLAETEGSQTEAVAIDTRLLGDLREVSRKAREALEAIAARHPGGNVAGRETSVELGRFMSERVRAFAELLGVGSGVRLLLSPSIEEVSVDIDPMLLSRAIEHLVRNAGQSITGEGRVRISWERARLEGTPGTAERGEGTGTPREVARIEVDDNGRGIAREALPWVFEPGFSTTPGEEGGDRDGLGLPFVQAVCELYGGWVDLHSDARGGTRVTMHFPLASDDPESAPVTGGPPPILLLADEPVVARYLSRVLEPEGHPVLALSTIGELERQLALHGVRPALVLIARTGPEAELLPRGLPILARLLDEGLPLLRVAPSGRGREGSFEGLTVAPASLLMAVRNAMGEQRAVPASRPGRDEAAGEAAPEAPPRTSGDFEPGAELPH